MYDGLGNLKQMISPDAGTIQYYYDDAGNVSVMIDANGKLTSYYYDACLSV